MDTPYFIPFPVERPVRIFHRVRGCGRNDYAVAQCADPDIAQRIVALLNADDRRLAEAATNRARALSINEEPA
jgi:hypothetical protein